MEIQTHPCRECGGELVTAPRGEASRLQRIFFGWTTLAGSVEVVRWVCLECGLMEHRVPAEALPRLRERLRR